MKKHPAYIAGVIDSDGSLSLAKRHINRVNPTYQGIFQLTWLKNNESIKFCEYLVNTYGGSYYTGKSHSGFKNPKPICKYMLTGKKLVPFLKAVKPYLLLKKEQAEIILEYRRTAVKPGTIGGGRGKSFDLLFYHDLLYLEMQYLKGKENVCS